MVCCSPCSAESSRVAQPLFVPSIYPLHPLIVVAIQDIFVPSHWVLETLRLSLAYLEGGAAHGLTSLRSVLNAAMFCLCSFWFVPILCLSFFFAEFEWLDLSCRSLLNIFIEIFLLCTKNCLDFFMQPKILFPPLKHNNECISMAHFEGLKQCLLVLYRDIGIYSICTRVSPIGTQATWISPAKILHTCGQAQTLCVSTV